MNCINSYGGIVFGDVAVFWLKKIVLSGIINFESNIKYSVEEIE